MLKRLLKQLGVQPLPPFRENDQKEYFQNLRESRFHIYGESDRDFLTQEYHPDHDVQMEELQPGMTVAVRAFFPTLNRNEIVKIDSGVILLEVECVDVSSSKIIGRILTELPHEFALAQGMQLELTCDQILSIEP